MLYYFIFQNQRVPADMIFLRTTDKTGITPSCIITLDKDKLLKNNLTLLLLLDIN